MSDQEIKYIAFEGVIGAGKSSLAKKLCDELNGKLVLEQFENNPFLERFYSDRKKYAFQTQLFFLTSRFKQQEELIQEELFENFLVSDYILDKDRIFAYLNLNGDELNLYESIFNTLKKNVRKPDVIVYLLSSVDRLMANIKRRNRPIEKNISKSYIAELNDAYNDYFFKYNQSQLIIVNTKDYDFLYNDYYFNELKKAIFRKDRGLVEFFQFPEEIIIKNELE